MDGRGPCSVTESHLRRILGWRTASSQMLINIQYALRNGARGQRPSRAVLGVWYGNCKQRDWPYQADSERLPSKAPWPEGVLRAKLTCTAGVKCTAPLPKGGVMEVLWMMVPGFVVGVLLFDSVRKIFTDDATVTRRLLAEQPVTMTAAATIVGTVLVYGALNLLRIF